MTWYDTANDSKGESIALKGHMGAVRSVDFSTDSRHLLTSSDDKTAKVSHHQESSITVISPFGLFVLMATTITLNSWDTVCISAADIHNEILTIML